MEGPTLAEVKTAIDESNRIWEGQFKEVAQKVKDLEAKGAAVDPILREKLDRLNDAYDKQAAVNDALIAKQAAQEAVTNRLERLGIDPTESKKADAQLQAFNRAIKSNALAQGRQAPADVDQKAYEAYHAALETYLRRGDRFLSPEEMKALSVGTDPNGGWVVTPDLSGRMIQRIFETSPMRQWASVQTIGTDALEGVADIDDASAGWVAETGTRSDTSTPNVPAPYRIPAHEAYAMPKATSKLIEDANVDVAAWVGRKFGDYIGRLANTAFVTGTGVGKPRGFASYTTATTADATRAWGTFQHTATGTSATFGTDPNGANKLLDLIHSMKDVYSANGAFYMNRTTLGSARKLTDASSAGHFLFVPSFTAALPDTFMGYPVRKLQDMADMGASSYSVAFGDMAETYQIVDRLGLTLLVDPYTAKPYIVYYMRTRVGGDVVNFESLKFLKFI